jgi:CRISPR-associated protein Cas4
MEYPIPISYLNDFVFCPISIYFHQLYGDTDRMLAQCRDQINGTSAHAAIDHQRYSNKKSVLQGFPIFCEKYGLYGKIDSFDNDKGVLTERKKKISVIYDGYVFQLYGQYFSLIEMGFSVHSIRFYSFDDNKVYEVNLPSENAAMLVKFEKTLASIRSFSFDDFVQQNQEKCLRCIYASICDRSLCDDDAK